MSATDSATKTATGAADSATNAVGNRKPTDVAGAASGVTGALDKPVGKKEQKESSLRIHIELDLDVEVHLTARVKGDITIGLL